MYILSHKEILLNEKSYNSIIVIALISFILPTASIMTHLSDLLMFYLLHLSPKQFVPNTNVFQDARMKELGHIGDNIDLIGPTFSIIQSTSYTFYIVFKTDIFCYWSYFRICKFKCFKYPYSLITFPFLFLFVNTTCPQPYFSHQQKKNLSQA